MSPQRRHAIAPGRAGGGFCVGIPVWTGLLVSSPPFAHAAVTQPVKMGLGHKVANANRGWMGLGLIVQISVAANTTSASSRVEGAKRVHNDAAQLHSLHKSPGRAVAVGQLQIVN